MDLLRERIEVWLQIWTLSCQPPAVNLLKRRPRLLGQGHQDPLDLLCERAAGAPTLSGNGATFVRGHPRDRKRTEYSIPLRTAAGWAPGGGF
ncbi:MAG: hypothetical protein JKY37_04945 [Nannocystaceae bacterium]|nr:hypothetical protein [Nannocystaceae bacterium]